MNDDKPPRAINVWQDECRNLIGWESGTYAKHALHINKQAVVGDIPRNVPIAGNPTPSLRTQRAARLAVIKLREWHDLRQHHK